MFSNRHTYGSGQFVAVAFYIVGERLFRIKLRVYLLRLGSIEHGRRLVDSRFRLLFYLYGLFSLHILREVVRLVCNNAISEPYVGTKAMGKNLAEQAHEMLFQVFVDKRTWNLHQESVLFS